MSEQPSKKSKRSTSRSKAPKAPEDPEEVPVNRPENLESTSFKEGKADPCSKCKEGHRRCERLDPDGPCERCKQYGLECALNSDIAPPDLDIAGCQDFWTLAPLFKAAFDTQSYESCLMAPDSRCRTSHSGVQHAIAAVSQLGPLHDEKHKLKAARYTEYYLQLAQGESLSIMDTGKIERMGNVLSTLSITLLDHLTRGIWLQNSFQSGSAMALCIHAGLYLDPGRLPDGQYGIEPEEGHDTHIHPGRLFWVLFILYTQVVSCSFPSSKHMLGIDEISLPLPGKINLPGPSPTPKTVGSENLFTDHSDCDWFGFYAKAALLLARTQEMLRQLFTSNPSPQQRIDQMTEISKIYKDVEQFRESWTNHYSKEQTVQERLSIRAMIAACYLLPREPYVYHLYGDASLHSPDLQLESKYVAACEEFVRDAHEVHLRSECDTLQQIADVFVVQVLMLVPRSCRENENRNTPPFLTRTPLWHTNWVAENCIAALEQLAPRMGAATNTLVLHYKTLHERYPREGWKAKLGDPTPVESKLAISQRFQSLSMASPPIDSLGLPHEASVSSTPNAGTIAPIDQPETQISEWQIDASAEIWPPAAPSIQQSDHFTRVEQTDQTAAEFYGFGKYPDAS